MKKGLILSSLALCALPALAQSQNVSLLYTQLTSRDLTLEGSVFSADKSSGYALRYGHDIAKFSQLGDARLAFEGTWMPRTSGEDIKADGEPLSSSMTIKYRHEYMGLGLSMTWTKIVDFGLALEARHEGNALRVEGPGASVEIGSDVTRPWISLRGGYSFPVANTKLFIGLEYNLPLAKKEVEINAAMGPFSEFMIAQNLNPKSQLTLNAGVRF